MSIILYTVNSMLDGQSTYSLQNKSANSYIAGAKITQAIATGLNVFSALNSAAKVCFPLINLGQIVSRVISIGCLTGHAFKYKANKELIIQLAIHSLCCLRMAYEMRGLSMSTIADEAPFLNKRWMVLISTEITLRYLLIYSRYKFKESHSWQLEGAENLAGE